MSAQVVVLGSANVDLIVRLARIPSPGETVLAHGSTRGPGGKGANQAVAAARGGAATTFIGAVGADDAGEFLIDGLRDAGVDSQVRQLAGVETGSALVQVRDDGENAIVVVPGANGRMLELTADEIETVRAGDVLLMQLEIPTKTVLAAARCAREAGTAVMLNAAPYADLPDELLAVTDVLLVNEHEATLAAGGRPDGPGHPAAADDDLVRLAESLLDRVPEAVLTLGARGCVLVARDRDPVVVAAPKVQAVDTTGAGDTFAGVLAASRHPGSDPTTALRRAASAAALAVQRPGAVTSIPSAAEIDAALRQFY